MELTPTLHDVMTAIRKTLQTMTSLYESLPVGHPVTGEGFSSPQIHFPYEPLIEELLKIPGVEREDYLRSDTSLEAPGFHGPDKWPHHWSQTVSYGGNYYVLRGSARIGGIEFGPEIFELED